jgi:FkbM family methyltransferase
VLDAIFQPQHYRALFNMWRVYPAFPENLWRYVSGEGTYPYDIEVRTPVGLVSIRLYSYHDILTVNEVFCRKDYPAGPDVKFVLDIGSNIGISALYFLTRNQSSECILYEPDPRNVQRLKANLAGLEHRFSLRESAVSDRSGDIEFGVEPSGRYGGIGVPTGESIVVRCGHVNEAIRDALQRFPRIDILKIDTEGVEVQTVEAIDRDLLPFIRRIFIEANPDRQLHGTAFRNRQYGSVRQLTQRGA